jgi:hypothetical protein
MGHHNPRHMKSDLAEMKSLGCDDVLLAAQENDFAHFTGKVEFLPGLARDAGLRPIAIFWGVLNLFGGGRSSQFLLTRPEGHQVNRDGSWNPAGCYVNPVCVGRVQEMIARVAELGYEGYFVDEPTPLKCYCPSCRGLYESWYGGDLGQVSDEQNAAFRRRCVARYVRQISDYVKANHPRLETMCCLMPRDRDAWAETATVASLDNLGTDIYWVNNDRNVEEMTPLVREMADLCRRHGKKHHQWLQAWKAGAGREQRIVEQGRILIREQPDAMWVWAYYAQIGTTETAQDPETAWARACQILREAKGL